MRYMNTKGKHEGSNHGKRLKPYYLYIIVAAVVLLVILAMLYSGMKNSINTSSALIIPNLNSNDLNSTIGINYTLSSYHLTAFASNLRKYGYIASNESIFNATTANSIYPASILSVVILARNTTAARDIVENLTFSNNAGQRISIQEYNAASRKIKIYTVFSVAVANLSGINYTYTYSMPIFQYTSLFSYNSYVGVITASLYRGDTNLNTTTMLAEKLLKKIINSS